ncbi:MAG: hypothetical protein OES57_19285, partial [Acidimicrobiia bacterium]|nr:hypothetical protein [Acidimicrobiia bacterium]
LLPGDDADRPVRAAAISLVVAAAAAFWFWQAGYVFAAFLLAVFGVQSLSVLVSSRRHRTHRAAADEAEDAVARLQAGDASALADLERIAGHTGDRLLAEQLTTLLVDVHATTNHPAEARRVLAATNVSIHPAWYGLVAMAEGDPSGCQQVIDAYRNLPNPSGARALTLACIRQGRDAEITGILTSTGALTPEQLVAAARAARSQRREDLARAIETIRSSSPGGASR